MLYTAICAIAKDENEYLYEWISYHLAIGFEHIILFDNNSKNPILNTVKNFVDKKYVTVIDFPYTENQQLSSYYSCLKKWKNTIKWIAFIDIDEFIVPVKHDDIRDVLDEYKRFSALGISWNIFSSNGYIGKPDGFVLENFTESMGFSCHIKSIVQPDKTSHPLSPHHFAYSSGYCVNEDTFPIIGPFSYPIGSVVQINHYYYKSQQEYEEKIKRGCATPLKGGKNRTLQEFYDHLKKKTHYDATILRFLSKIKKIPDNAPLLNSLESNEERMNSVIHLLENGKIHSAEKVYRKMQRYGDTIETALIGSTLSAVKRDFKTGVSLLSEALLRYPEASSVVLSSLQKLYGACGRKEVGDRVRDFVNDQTH